MNTLSKAIIIIAVILGLAWVGFFVKYRYLDKNPSPAASPSNTKLPSSASVNDEKDVKTLAENFLSGYGSYQKGNFSSLKEVKKMMTKKYQEETARFIEEKEQNTAGTKEYISYTSIPAKTTIVSLDARDAKSAKVLVNFEYNTFYGVSLYLNGNLTTIDQSGSKTTQPLKRETAKKQAIILMVKEDGLWKVDSIKIEQYNYE